MTLAPDVTSPDGQLTGGRQPAEARGIAGYVPGAILGGPLGRHARRLGVLTPLALLVCTTILTCLAGYGLKLPCRDVGNWKSDFQYTHVCYSDILPLYSSEKLSDGKAPYVDYPVEYPVLIGAAMEAGAVVARAAPADDFTARNALFFDATAILLTLAALVTVITTALTAGRRRMDVVLLAAAPLLAFHAFTNWDLLAVAFTAAGMLAWSKKAPAVAGLLFGFGAATKAYPLLVLIALGLLAYRAGRMGVWARCAAWAAGALAATYAVVWPFAGSYLDDSGHSHSNLWKFVQLNQDRPADWDSLPYVLQYLGRATTTSRVVSICAVIGLLVVGLVGLWRRTARSMVITGAAVVVVALAVTEAISYARSRGAIPSSILNSAGVIGAVLLFAAIGYVVMTAPRRPRVPQVAFLVVIAFLVANKVDSPQYSLWLLPLAVLAYPRWKPLLGWQIIEIFEVVMRYLWFNFNDSTAFGKHGVGEGWFVSAVVLRQAALLVLAGLVIREIYRPQLDVVRDVGVDDPAGGVFDGLPDRRVFA